MQISWSDITFERVKRFITKRCTDFRVNKIRTLPRKQHGTFSFNGYTMDYIDPLSFYHQYKDIFKDKVYHFQTTNRAPVILDAGGSIGMSVLYFKSLYPQAKITVFEPDYSIFQVLEKNVATNKLSGVTCINAGVGKLCGDATFYADNSDGGSCYQHQGTKPVSIKLVQLSDYITGPVDLLKLDIEGMEGEVFDELAHKLDLIDQIVFEYHDFYNVPQSLGTILTLLERAHFAYLVADVTNVQIPRPFTLPQHYRYLNMVYAKKMK